MTSIRPAGYLERWHITRSALALDPCVVSAAKYYLDDETPVPNHELFLKALSNVVRRKAALRVRVPDVRSSAPVFVAVPFEEIKLSALVAFVDKPSPSMDEIAQDQFQKAIDTHSDQPIWRVVVYSDWRVVFAWHHAIADGLSSIAFHRTLVDALQDLSEDPDFVSPLSEVFHPALDQILDVSPPMMLVLKNVAALFLPSSWPLRRCWTGNPVSLAPTFAVKVRFLYFSATVTRSLLALSRENKATLTGLFHELAVTILSRIIDGNKWRKIPCNIAVSLRSLTKVSQDDFCDHVSAHPFKAPVRSTFSWDEAKKTSDVLKQAGSTAMKEVGLLRFIFGQFEVYFKGRLGKTREKGLEVSNLGRVPPFERKGPWSIDDFAWAQFDVPGPALSIGIVSSHTGKLAISVRWGEGMSDELGESFFKLYNEELHSLANNESK